MHRATLYDEYQQEVVASAAEEDNIPKEEARFDGKKQQPSAHPTAVHEESRVRDKDAIAVQEEDASSHNALTSTIEALADHGIFVPPKQSSLGNAHEITPATSYRNKI